MRLGDRTVAGQVDLRRPRERRLRLQDVLRMSTRTAPGRPLSAIWNASAITFRDVGGGLHQELCLVMGIVIPEMSASWKPSVPMSAGPPDR